LDPNFHLPMEPFWVAVPPQHQEQLELNTATFRDPNRPVLEKLTDSQRRAKRLRTTGKSFFISNSLTSSLIIFL
jgi:hypothetical protein